MLFASGLCAKLAFATIEYAKKRFRVYVINDMSFQPVETARWIVVDIATGPQTPETFVFLLRINMFRFEVFDQRIVDVCRFANIITIVPKTFLCIRIANYMIPVCHGAIELIFTLIS
jgi:hypothetical protein